MLRRCFAGARSPLPRRYTQINGIYEGAGPVRLRIVPGFISEQY
jgi:hypothetical protein